MKLVHVSDVHLGYQRFNKINPQGVNQREWDIIKSFEEVVHKIVSLGPDLVIISGDLFDSPRPSNLSLISAIQLFGYLKNSRVIIIHGNHDKPKRREIVSPIECLKFYPNIYVVTSNAILRFDDIACVVYCMVDISECNTFLREMYGHKNYFKILTAHTLVRELDPRFDFSIIEINSKYPMDYIALGDLHQARELAPNIWYSGSIDWVSSNFWSEVSVPKVFLEIDSKPFRIIKHRVVSARPVIVFDPIDCTNILREELLDILEGYADPDKKEVLAKVSLVNCNRDHLNVLSSSRFKAIRSKFFHLQVDVQMTNYGDRKSSDSFFKSTILDEFTDFLSSRAIEFSHHDYILGKFRQFLESENR